MSQPCKNPCAQKTTHLLHLFLHLFLRFCLPFRLFRLRLRLRLPLATGLRGSDGLQSTSGVRHALLDPNQQILGMRRSTGGGLWRGKGIFEFKKTLKKTMENCNLKNILLHKLQSIWFYSWSFHHQHDFKDHVPCLGDHIHHFFRQGIRILRPGMHDATRRGFWCFHGPFPHRSTSSMIGCERHLMAMSQRLSLQFLSMKTTFPLWGAFIHDASCFMILFMFPYFSIFFQTNKMFFMVSSEVITPKPTHFATPACTPASSEASQGARILRALKHAMPKHT